MCSPSAASRNGKDMHNCDAIRKHHVPHCGHRTKRSTSGATNGSSASVMQVQPAPGSGAGAGSAARPADSRGRGQNWCCWPQRRRSTTATATPSAPGAEEMELGAAGAASSAGAVSPEHPDCFTAAIRHAIIAGYCFSLLHPHLRPCRGPIPRRRGWSPLRMLRTLYAGIVVAGLGVQAGLSLYREMTSESLWDSSVDMMFFGSAAVAPLLFLLDLGPKWGQLVAAFESVETLMSDFGYPANLRRDMKELTAIVMLAAVVEHLLSVWSTVVYSWPCYGHGGPAGLLKGYSLLKFPMTFDVVEYEHWKAFVVLTLNFMGTFFWNYTHLFIMLVSMPLSKRFKQLNQRLESATREVMEEAFWRQAREIYNELSVLVRKVDEVIGKLILLSFATNMYFICRQLLHSFRTLRTGFWYNVYFTYSFVYMLARTVLVSMYAAAVNDESRRPLFVMFSAPSEGYTHEVERFISQVSRDHVSLTGCRFFSVTRGLILTASLTSNQAKGSVTRVHDEKNVSLLSKGCPRDDTQRHLESLNKVNN